VNTFVRMAPEVVNADIEYADGSMDTLTGTPNHPFWVPATRDYVPLGELEVGTVLHVQGGGEAILVSKTWRQGDFEVFDFEVEGLHNFYARGPGGDAAGVLVHNSTGAKGAFHVTPKGTALPPGKDVDLVPTASGKKVDFMQIHQSHEHKLSQGLQERAPPGWGTTRCRRPPTGARDLGQSGALHRPAGGLRLGGGGGEGSADEASIDLSRVFLELNGQAIQEGLSGSEGRQVIEE